MLLGACGRLALPALLVCIGAPTRAQNSAAADPLRIAPLTPREARVEIARGASVIAATISKKYPYATAYRLMRASLEKNVQERRDSDAFLLGAHLIIAVWLSGLPNDVAWRDKALARHCDLVEWLLPRVALPTDDAQRAAARAAALTVAQAKHLSELLQDLAPKQSGSKD